MERFIVASRKPIHPAPIGAPGVDGRDGASAADPGEDGFAEAVGLLGVRLDVRRAAGPARGGRWRIHVEGTAHDLHDALARMPGDVVAEPALPRCAATLGARAVRSSLAPNGGPLPAAGVGAGIDLAVRTAGRAVAGAQVSLALADGRGRPLQTMVEARTDAGGRARLRYDPNLWAPTLLMVQPRSGCWGAWRAGPHGEVALDLPPLPMAGPVGWWHLLSGVGARRRDRGAGIRVGVVDSGVGPHPHLSHVASLGSVVDAHQDASPEAGADILGHGTHVAGIVGARPPDGSAGYVGLAEGADIVAVRVFPAEGDANQGDIAEAIERLALAGCDLINLSLGGAQPSEIERDAVRTAAARGSLCIAAAGNGFGQPVLYPAAYPEVAAVSALGVVGAYPPGTMEAQSLPARADQYGAGFLFLGSFSNVGPEMSCAAPGVGIVSTVPARPGADAPYAVDSGTSMAAPVATAALAGILAQDRTYAGLPRDLSRTQRASATLAASLRPLGMSPLYVGGGLSQAGLSQAGLGQAGLGQAGFAQGWAP